MADPIEDFRKQLIADADSALAKSWFLSADLVKRINAAKSVLQKYEVSTRQFVNDVLVASQVQPNEEQGIWKRLLRLVFGWR